MSACVEGLHEAEKQDAIVAVEKAERSGQTALTVRLPNWLPELGMPRLTHVQAKTGIPKCEDQPFLKG
jgi:hypothetical protein